MLFFLPFVLMKKILFVFLLCMIWQEGFSQYVYGTTGLLHMPTADMQRDKTFLFGASYLDVAATPAHWNYHTFNYYINITIFPWLEIGYTCTLHKANMVVLISHLPFGGNIVTRTDSFQGGCVYGKKGGGKNGLLRLYWARMIQVPMIY